MNGPSARQLADLLSATESVRDDDGLLRRVPDCRQQRTLPHLLRDLEMIFLEAERSRHAAAARIQDLYVRCQLFNEVPLTFEVQHGLVMTVAVQEQLLLKLRELRSVPMLVEKLSQQKRLLRQAFGVLVIR